MLIYCGVMWTVESCGRWNVESCGVWSHLKGGVMCSVSHVVCGVMCSASHAVCGVMCSVESCGVIWIHLERFVILNQCPK